MVRVFGAMGDEGSIGSVHARIDMMECLMAFMFRSLERMFCNRFRLLLPQGGLTGLFPPGAYPERKCSNAEKDRG